MADVVNDTDSFGKDLQRVRIEQKRGVTEMDQILDGSKIVLGVCYYPEHWEKDDWERDMRRMLEYGIEAVRVAEFSWSKVEPTEGEYTYEFWDSFLDIAHGCGMRVIFCTPTATPPAWLTEGYPEVLNADIDGNVFHHGNRQHTNYNSMKYQEFSRNITEKIAAHYASHPAIIGWQLDNELNCGLNVFYSKSDTYAFRQFLKEKYGCLDMLNSAWGTVFWNQTYTSWSEIYVPRKVGGNSPNPHRMLDYLRFISDSACRFAKQQADIIKKYKKPEDFITTNGLFGHLDSHKLTGESLDFFMYDSYPNFAYVIDGSGLKGLKDRKWSRNLSEIRSISPIFGVMEQQSGANGWNTGMEACSPRPGQMSLWSVQSIAHGADYVSYFRWRTCTVGTEMYWHGLLDYSGRENRRMRELLDFHKKLQNLHEVAGANYKAKVGVLQDYDNQWDSEIDVWHGHVERISKEGIFSAAQHLHVPMDYVNLCESTTLDDLRKYELLFYPHAAILNQKRASLLEAYVEQGGKLVFGCRTGYKDMNGKCTRSLLPAYVANLTGTDIQEYSFTAPDEPDVCAEWGGTHIKVAVFNDMPVLLNDSARVLAHYTNGIFAGEAALIENEYGSGKAYYFGGAFCEETAKVFLKKLGADSPYSDILELPQCCELAVRANKDADYFFVLNYDKNPVMILVKERMKNIYVSEVWEGECELAGYGVAVLKMQK